VRRRARYRRSVVAEFLVQPRVRRAADVLLAVGLTGLALVEVLFVADARSSWGGHGPVQVALALLGTAPVAWRVRFPIASALVVSVSTGVLVVLAAPHQAPFEPFVAVVVAAYSVGAHAPGRRGVVGFAAMFALGLPFSIAARLEGEGGGNILPTIVWLFGFWLVGRVIHSWRGRAQRLEVLTQELEAQRELQAEAAVAVERGRIARELHDVIAHNVSMIVVQAGAAARVLRGDEPDVRAALEAIETTGRETVDEMRRMLGIVRGDGAVSLAPQPSLREVERLVTNVREAGLDVELRIEGEPIALAPGIDLSAFRIVQEALTNALKHAGDAQAVVTVRYAADGVEVEVVDDGRGDGGGGGTGHGLIGMRERVAVWGGELEARRREEGGFLVRATLPAVP
jgi:signal transduction histidine kinase